MTVEIRQLGPESFDAYARVPIAFRVESILRVEVVDRGLGGLAVLPNLAAEKAGGDPGAMRHPPAASPALRPATGWPNSTRKSLDDANGGT